MIPEELFLHWQSKMAQRRNYWANSSFSHWLLRTFGRGTAKKPESATLKEWKEWKKSTKQAAPFIYWFAEEFLDDL